MKFAVVLLLAAGVVLAEEPPLDTARLQGTWQVEKFTDNGDHVELATGFGAIIKGDTFQVTASNLPEPKVSLRVDNTKEPMWVDFVDEQGRIVHKGIYEVDGNRLKLCYSINGARPDRFVSAKDSGTRLVFLKRDNTRGPRE
jgi:uncharacterized protein (TIGR03067 family)